jgi:transposase-like protein
MIAFAADRLMALEVDGLCGAGHGERNAERSNHRNGYRERALGDPSRRHYPADPQAPLPSLSQGM